MRSLAILSLSLLLTACSLVSPYKVTFTTPDGAVVDPAIATLDFVVSAPALAYISEVDCDAAEEIELLPVVTDDMQPKTAYNLSLSMLNGAPGAECEITVTAFDQTTTTTSREEIKVVIAGEPVEETEETTEETTEAEPAVEPASEVETEVEAELEAATEAPAAE